MSWDIKKIGEIICENKKSKYKVRDSSNDGLFPFFTSGEKINRFSEYICEGENIFIATGGKANFQYHIGKAAYSTDCYSIKSNEKVLSKFLYYFLKMNKKKINDEMFRGAALKHLQKKEFKNIDISLPPLSVQKQIVEKLDATFADIDKAISATEKNIENAEALFQKSLDITFEDTSNNPLQIKFGDFFQIKHGYAFKSEGFTLEPSKYTLLTPGNFYEKGGFRPQHKKQKYFVGDVREDFILSPKNLLLAMTEQAAGLLGSPLIVPSEGVYLHNQRLGLVTSEHEWHTKYLFHLCNTSSFRRQIHKSGTGVKVRHSSPAKISNIIIRYNDNQIEQKLIADSLDKQSMLQAKLVSIYYKKISELNSLRSSILSQAFSGELTKDVA